MTAHSLPPKPYFKLLFFILTASLGLFSLATGYVAVKFFSISVKASLVWTAPALISLLMATFPVIFYLSLRLGSRSWLFYVAQRYCVRVFFPLILFLGERLRVERDILIRELVQYNNKYVLRKYAGCFSPNQILVLLPHCLQVRDCDHRVTTDISRCAMCGRCTIHRFVQIGLKYGVHIETATGGTLARRIIKDRKPSVIVAVACSRDLYSGLSDTFPLPVVGIFNELHYGPCIDTTVDAAKIDQTLATLIRPGGVTESFAQDL